MTLKEASERIDFERILADEVEDYAQRQIVRANAKLLLRHGKTYARLQEMACNGPGTWFGESNESFARREAAFNLYRDRKEELLEKRIRSLVTEMGTGFGVTFGGDPRGCTMIIQVPSGKTNGWGREGICVPTA